jgi:hypothetical protein
MRPSIAADRRLSKFGFEADFYASASGCTKLTLGCPHSTPIPISFPGTGDTILKAGESLKIDMEFSGLNLMKMEVTEVIVTVKELSRVKDVSWRIDISH